MSVSLEVDDLSVGFQTPRGVVQAVRGVSFGLNGGRIGIVGESGSGKSTVARSLMGLLPSNALVTARRMTLGNRDLSHLARSEWTRVRGREIGMILQDPKYSLNPVLRVGDQVAEGLRIHLGMDKASAKRATLKSLEEVQIRDPERVAAMYPHELSGGMGQRVMIAAVLVTQPKLLIADEPTSALDATVARQVLNLLDELIDRHGMGLLLISHNLPLVSAFCDQVLVMHSGLVVERCEASQMAHAQHPYTRALMSSMPDIHSPGRVLPVVQRDAPWMK